jgi:glycosyltransferase involved in cell wall biosynthesis
MRLNLQGRWPAIASAFDRLSTTFKAPRDLTPGERDLLASLLSTTDYAADFGADDDIVTAFLNDKPTVVSPFFDPALYAQRADAPELERAGARAAILHWIQRGAARRIVPTSAFDETYYLDANEDVRAAGVFGFEHFLRHGIAERRPSRAEPAARTARRETRISTAVAREAQKLVAASLATIAPVRKDAEARAMRERLVARLAQAAPAFGPDDSAFLASLYPAPGSDDAVSEFLNTGLWEGMTPPGFAFDAARHDQIIAALGMPRPEDTPAFLHWLTVGRPLSITPVAEPDETMPKEVRAVLRAMFSPAWYLETLSPAARKSATDPFEHFLKTRLTTDHAFSPLFDAHVYGRQAAVAGLGEVVPTEALVHWLDKGLARGIVPNHLFDEIYYQEVNPDVAALGRFGFVHWLLHGRDEGRSPSPFIGGERSEVLELFHPKVFDGLTRRSRAPQFSVPPAFRFQLSAKATTVGFLMQAMAPLRRVLSEFHPGDAALIAQMFTTKSYIAAAGLPVGTSDERALDHFLRTGLWQDVSPSPLFDAAYYRSQIDTGTLTLPAFLDWLAYGREHRIVPTPRFDEEFYSTRYVDLADPRLDLFLHFVMHGMREGRSPNLLFDPFWYAVHTPQDPETPAYMHYLVTTADEGAWPSKLVAAHAGMDERGFRLSQFDDGLRAIAALKSLYTPFQIELAMALFTPADPRRLGRSWDLLIEYLGDLAGNREYSGTLFDPVYYRTRANEAGLRLGDETAVHHFLVEGRAAEIVPTAAFDEAYYLRVHSDLRESLAWPFEHFIEHGLYEGRQPNGGPTMVIATAFASKKIPAESSRWIRYFEAELSTGRPDTDTARSPNRHVANVISSDLFQEVMRRALDIEPEVGDPRFVRSALMAPLHDPVSSRNSELAARLVGRRYDTVICIPWLRMGGADLVACLVAEALTRIQPDERVLMLQIDSPIVERADWKPENVDIIDISDLMWSVDQEQAQRLLYVGLVGLAPKRVINVNSRVCWLTFRRFGRLMTDMFDLYAYMFCWDRTPEGIKAGYPSEFYAETAPVLKGLLTDTDYLKAELSRMYAPPPMLRDRLRPLYSPMRTPPWKTSAAVLRSQRKTARSVRPRILWGARLDRQKRFDLVLRIAAAMPEADFVCWGAAILDAPPDLSNAPFNLTLLPPFKSFDELELEKADVWLFTAEWEGLPTMLIELAARGMPIVASAVGGVPELITEETGWPIRDIEDIDAYVAALRQAISEPETRVRRAEALKTFASERHAASTYDRALREALDLQGVQ